VLNSRLPGTKASAEAMAYAKAAINHAGVVFFTVSFPKLSLVHYGIILRTNYLPKSVREKMINPHPSSMHVDDNSLKLSPILLHPNADSQTKSGLMSVVFMACIKELDQAVCRFPLPARYIVPHQHHRSGYRIALVVCLQASHQSQEKSATHRSIPLP
jgi:hypothetical protein